jgi:hypothetical protein
MDKKRMQQSNRVLKVGPPASGQLARPAAVTYAFLSITAGAGLAFIVATGGLVNAPWATAQAVTIILVAVSFAVASAWFVVLPVVAGLLATRGRRWPVIYLTVFAATQVLTLGLSPVLGVLSSLLTVLGCVLLWLPKSRAYSKSISSHRRELRRS